MAKIDIALQMLREQFTEALREAFAERFSDVQLSTSWNIFSGTYVTTRDDGAELHEEQFGFIAGFEAAWRRASNIIAEER